MKEPNPITVTSSMDMLGPSLSDVTAFRQAVCLRALDPSRRPMGRQEQGGSGYFLRPVRPLGAGSIHLCQYVWVVHQVAEDRERRPPRESLGQLVW